MPETILHNIEQYFLSLQKRYGNTLHLQSGFENIYKIFDSSVNISYKNSAEMHDISKNKNTPLRDTELKDKSKNAIFGANISETIKNNKPWQNAMSIDELYSKIKDCRNCPLGDSRIKFVFGAGNPNADLLVIGEAPGAEEDEQGLPFVGRAGQLLSKILESINLKREDVFIANILKCRPPNNRRPVQSETDECEPYLFKQIELIKPAFILALGLTAVDTLLKKTHKMADTRGKLFDYHGSKMLVTYHPSALLRNPNLKVHVWEDVKYLRRLLDDNKAKGY